MAKQTNAAPEEPMSSLVTHLRGQRDKLLADVRADLLGIEIEIAAALAATGEAAPVPWSDEDRLSEDNLREMTAVAHSWGQWSDPRGRMAGMMMKAVAELRACRSGEILPPGTEAELRAVVADYARLSGENLGTALSRFGLAPKSEEAGCAPS